MPMVSIKFAFSIVFLPLSMKTIRLHIAGSMFDCSFFEVFDSLGAWPLRFQRHR